MKSENFKALPNRKSEKSLHRPSSQYIFGLIPTLQFLIFRN